MNACAILNAQIAFFILYVVLQEALRTRGLKDDTTCVVVDIIPPDNSIPPSTPPKKQNKLRALLFRKKSHFSASKLSKKLSAIGIVEELFEEGSAMLAERLVLSFLHAFFHIDFPPAILHLCPIHYTSYSMKSKFLAEGEETCIMFYQFHIICYHCVNSLTIANKLK
jgi:hypothetical protein